MTGRRLPSFLLLIGALLLPSAAHADDQYTFDKTATSIRFAVDDVGFMQIDGEFTRYDGAFIFSPGQPEKDTIDITLDSTGIHTGDDERDAQLQGPDFFDAARFPQIHFTSTKMNFIDDNDADVEGELTLLGITKPITLHVRLVGETSNDNAIDFTADGTLDRSDFGMDHMTPIIGNEVRLHIEARGQKTGS